MIRHFFVFFESKLDLRDIRFLIAHVLDVSDVYIISHDERRLTYSEVFRVLRILRKRLRGIPVAYLVGTKEFYGYPFHVTSATLVPRPETELIVDDVLTRIDTTEHTTILDIGTGSGNIIVSIAKELAKKCDTLSRTTFIASDISPAALTIARANARDLGVDEITFVHSDLLADDTLTKQLYNGDHLIITANLPYVDFADKDALFETSESRALAFEPESALFSHTDGLAHYVRLFRELRDKDILATVRHITVLCEINDNQRDGLSDIITQAFPHATLKTLTDLAGHARIIVCDFRG